jgi:hypothetical protein
MPSIETSTPRKSVLGRVLQRMERRATASRLSVGRPSEPLLGLPLKRLVPQDIHTANDHAVTLANVIAARCANSTDARAVALALAGSALVVNLLTDYRLSLARLIPIEVHEGFDHLWGATNILAPFLLGYVRKSPLAAAIQIFTGAATILESLFTDYRAATGVRWGGA